MSKSLFLLNNNTKFESFHLQYQNKKKKNKNKIITEDVCPFGLQSMFAAFQINKGIQNTNQNN